MEIKNLPLNIDYPKMGLQTPETLPTFTGFVLQNHEEYNPDELRPAVIICPGGGYRMTSQREATPVAMEFVAKGVTAFVLHYSVAPSVFPTSLVEVATAVALVRSKAKEFNIDPNNISVLGFSAGGHLTASIGVFWNHKVLRDIGFNDDSHKPNSILLCYAVISAVQYSHKGSFKNLLAEKVTDQAMLQEISLESQVTADLPPVFLWHTCADPGVPVQNSLLFALAATNCGVTTEMHIYPKGGHGLSLANELVCKGNQPPRVEDWINHAVAFAKGDR